MREDIRQLIIFAQNPNEYLSYVTRFRERCFDKYRETRYAEDCAEHVMDSLNLDSSVVNLLIDTFLDDCVNS